MGGALDSTTTRPPRWTTGPRRDPGRDGEKQHQRVATPLPPPRPPAGVVVTHVSHTAASPPRPATPSRDSACHCVKKLGECRGAVCTALQCRCIARAGYTGRVRYATPRHPPDCSLIGAPSRPGHPGNGGPRWKKMTGRQGEGAGGPGPSAGRRDGGTGLEV